MSSLDHWDIVGSIPNGQGYFVEALSHQQNHLCFLDGQQTAADDSLAFLAEQGQLFFAAGIAKHMGEV